MPQRMPCAVSIILPVWNGARFIARAIGGVLKQSFVKWELIVVDDGSTDETPEIVASFAKRDARIRYVRNPENLGIQRTLNRGLREARGAYVARVDDDDWWSDAEKLAQQVAFLDAHPDVVLVGTGTVVVGEDGKERFRFLQPETDEGVRKRILFKNCFTHSSVMFRRDAALNFGGYAEGEDGRHVEDYDLWLKLGTIGKFANLPIYATAFTLRAGAISARHKAEQLRKDIHLAKTFRKSYPGFLPALLFGYLRLLLYRCSLLVPTQSVKETALKLYKRG